MELEVLRVNCEDNRRRIWTMKILTSVCKYSGSSFLKTHFGSKRVVSINDVLLTA